MRYETKTDLSRRGFLGLAGVGTAVLATGVRPSFAVDTPRDPGRLSEMEFVIRYRSRIYDLPSDAEITTMANALCEDGASPDGDSFVDCEDFDCTGDPLVTVCPVENTDALCANEMDDDDNGSSRAARARALATS